MLGIGLNFRLSTSGTQRNSGEWRGGGGSGADRRAVDTGRNLLAAAILSRLVEVLTEFEQHGFRPFMNEWRDADALSGEPIRVLLGEQTQRGIARGIDEDGRADARDAGRSDAFCLG